MNSKKKTTEKKPYKLLKRRDGRFSVKMRAGKMLKGDAKVEVLAKEGLIKVLKKKVAAAET